MTIAVLKSFFLWCLLLNVGFFLAAFVFLKFGEDLVFHVHGAWYDISKEQVRGSMYTMMAVYKMMITAFNLVPYLALLFLG